MMIVQTPRRLSFLGGGTDFEDFYKLNGGGALHEFGELFDRGWQLRDAVSSQLSQLRELSFTIEGDGSKVKFNYRNQVKSK